jgi:hypothetical protein
MGGENFGYVQRRFNGLPFFTPFFFMEINALLHLTVQRYASGHENLRPALYLVG